MKVILLVFIKGDVNVQTGEKNNAISVMSEELFEGVWGVRNALEVIKGVLVRPYKDADVHYIV